MQKEEKSQAFRTEVLKYFNEYLFQKGLITERERNAMLPKIKAQRSH